MHYQCYSFLFLLSLLYKSKEKILGIRYADIWKGFDRSGNDWNHRFLSKKINHEYENCLQQRSWTQGTIVVSQEQTESSRTMHCFLKRTNS